MSKDKEGTAKTRKAMRDEAKKNAKSLERSIRCAMSADIDKTTWSAEEIAKAVRCDDLSKIVAAMKRLAKDEEVEKKGFGDEAVWTLTELGKFHNEVDDDDEFESILEANYIKTKIKERAEKEKKSAKKPRRRKDECNVQSEENIKLLTVDLRKAWEADKTERRALVLPSRMSPDTLEHDVEKGAIPFRSMLEMTEKDLDSKVVIFRTTNEEYGLFAAAYMAAKQRKHDDVFSAADPELFDLADYSPAEDGTVSNVIPTVNVYETINENPGVFFGMGSLTGNAITVNDPKTPYWVDHYGSVIVTIRADIGMYDRETISDSIGRLYDNKDHIYVVYVEYADDWYMEEEEAGGFFSSYTRTGFLNALVKYDAACFDIVAKDDTEYYINVITGLCDKYGLTISKAYTKKEVVEAISKATGDMKCEFMDQLLRREANRSETKVIGKELVTLLGHLKTADTNRLHGWELLDSLEGMQNTKEQIKALVNVMKFNKARKTHGMKCEPVVACMFAGAPGTAKTSVAEALADILAEEHILPGKRFESVTGSGLQAEYVGQTSAKVRCLAERTDVLLIDECYSLSQSMRHGSPYAAEALAELCVLMTEAAEKGNKLFIFAGYGGSDSTSKNNLMKQFLNSNPGIKSRVSVVVDFPSYSPCDMSEIFMKICANDGFSFEDKEKSALKQEVEEFFSERVDDPSFGNGREARNLVQEAMRMHAEVLEGKSMNEITEEELSVITADDVHKAIESLKTMELTRSGKSANAIGLVK
ncbi:MAG: AAA family ATPase [Lachnospiraceae bacterium]|nr:AAA family ATPase [Lachnospiraceae bacterium]